MQLEKFHTNNCPVNTQRQMHDKNKYKDCIKNATQNASRMERKKIAPSGNMFEVASSNASAHFQLEINFVHHVSSRVKM